jgi:hypothetical protein
MGTGPFWLSRVHHHDPTAHAPLPIAFSFWASLIKLVGRHRCLLLRFRMRIARTVLSSESVKPSETRRDRGLRPQCPRRSRTLRHSLHECHTIRKRSESLLKTFKLLSQYRTIDHLDALLDKLAWEALRSFGTEPDFRLTSMLKCLLADPRTDCHEASNRQNVGGRRGEVRT